MFGLAGGRTIGKDRGIELRSRLTDDTLKLFAGNPISKARDLEIRVSPKLVPEPWQARVLNLFAFQGEGYAGAFYATSGLKVLLPITGGHRLRWRILNKLVKGREHPEL